MDDAVEVDQPFAGFWRRLGAIVVDCLLLGLSGLLCGFFLFDFLAGLGPWGRLLGFGVALAYFGTLNSRAAGGQTVGKRLFKIKVVGADGAPLSLGKAALRQSVFALPWFLNNAWIPPSALAAPWVQVLALLVFGVALAIAYLAVFNRPTRQSLHDLIVGSYVVRHDVAGAIRAPPVARQHLIAVAVCAVLALSLPALMSRLVSSESLLPLMTAFRALNDQPGVRYVQVSKGWTRGPGGEFTYIQVNAFVTERKVEDTALAGRLARVAMESLPSADVNVVQVNLIYGFDIGIASASRTYTHANSPQGWSAR